MESIVVDIFAPILPGKSLGGISIGIHINELAKNVKLGPPDTAFAGTDEYLILDSDGAVSVGVHHDTGIILRISALKGYKGMLFGKYAVGMPMNMVLSDPDWRYSHEFGVMKSQTQPGVAIATEVFDPDECDLPGMNIFEIAVYDANDQSMKSVFELKGIG